MTVVERLQVIRQHGATAHRAEADRLIAALAVDPEDPQALLASVQLVDAYLHDPHLERG